MKKKKERVTRNVGNLLREYVPPIIKEETTRNKLTQQKPIFECWKSLHAPFKVCGDSNALGGALLHAPTTF